MKRYLSKDLGLTSQNGQYITDRSDVDIITFSASSFTNPYIIPGDEVKPSKVREGSGDYDFFEYKNVSKE